MFVSPLGSNCPWRPAHNFVFPTYGRCNFLPKTFFSQFPYHQKVFMALCSSHFLELCRYSQIVFYHSHFNIFHWLSKYNVWPTYRRGSWCCLFFDVIHKLRSKLRQNSVILLLVWWESINIKCHRRLVIRGKWQVGIFLYLMHTCIHISCVSSL